MSPRTLTSFPDIIGAILADPHVDADYKRHLTTPQAFLKSRDEQHNARRRYLDQPEPVTGFNDLDSERTVAQRAVDYAEYVRELRNDCADIDERAAA